MLQMLGILAALNNPAVSEPCNHGPVPKSIATASRRDSGLVRPYVQVQFVVAPDGSLTSATLVQGSGNPADDKSALDAAGLWRFLPARTSCEPVAATVTFVVGIAREDAFAPANPITFADPCNHESVLTDAVAPPYPQSAKNENLGPVTTSDSVDVDEQGRVTGITTTKSSGLDAIDAAARWAAARSNYFAKVKACIPVSAAYIFRANFDPAP